MDLRKIYYNRIQYSKILLIEARPYDILHKEIHRKNLRVIAFCCEFLMYRNKQRLNRLYHSGVVALYKRKYTMVHRAWRPILVVYNLIKAYYHE